MLQFPGGFEKAGNQAAISGAKCHLSAETAGWLWSQSGSNLALPGIRQKNGNSLLNREITGNVPKIGPKSGQFSRNYPVNTGT
jgi:hypothetical protein